MSLEKYINQFESKTKTSQAFWSEAKQMLPGGVAGGAGFLAPNPVYLKKAQGGKLYDVDGNEYIDLLLGGFLNILGHSSKPVMDAVKAQLDLGTAYILFHETGMKLTQKMQQYLPHMEKIRFCNSGTEATMFAIRAARSFTQKEKIAKPEGGYNGQHDYVLMSISSKMAGSDEKPLAAPESAGIPKYIQENTIVFPWNDLDATISIIEENADELAAIIVEPLPGFGMGALPPEEGYLEAIREAATKNNIILIFDEIAVGFRIGGMSGPSKLFGLTPDLACYGKVIGGGLPIGAFGGRADLMEKTLSPAAEPEYKIFQSGTFTGNALSMAAGLACLNELEKKDYSHIDSLAEQIRTEIPKMAEKYGFKIQMTGIGSIFYPHFNDAPVRNLRDKMKDDAVLNRAYCMGLVANGIYMPPGHAGATCFAHTQKDIDTVLKISDEVLAAMKEQL